MEMYSGTYKATDGRVLAIKERWYKWNKGKPLPTQIEIIDAMADTKKTYPISEFIGWLDDKLLKRIN